MKKMISAIACSLAVMTALSPLASLSSYAEQAVESTNSLDYSKELSERVYVSPSDLLVTLITDTYAMSSAEKSYLDRHFEEYLIYSSTIPRDTVTVSRNGASVTVKAEAYSYVAENGRTVTFLPVYVSAGGEKYTLTEKNSSFEVSFTTADSSICVYYNGSLPIPASTANTIKK